MKNVDNPSVLPLGKTPSLTQGRLSSRMRFPRLARKPRNDITQEIATLLLVVRNDMTQEIAQPNGFANAKCTQRNDKEHEIVTLYKKLLKKVAKYATHTIYFRKALLSNL